MKNYNNEFYKLEFRLSVLYSYYTNCEWKGNEEMYFLEINGEGEEGGVL